MELEYPLALELCLYLLSLSKEKKHTISFPKMNWMLYFSQGVSLACFNKLCFSEKIRRKLKSPSIDRLEQNMNCEIISILNEEEFEQTRNILNAVFEEYYQIPDKNISNEMMGHFCWNEAKIGAEITIDSLKKCFTSLALFSIKKSLNILKKHEEENWKSIIEDQTKEEAN